MAALRTTVVRSSVVVFMLFALTVATPQDKPSEKRKRQIFREQVLPHSGGKIPEDAFRADRLALNRLNKDGIAVPDGILLDARRHDKHPNVMRNSDLEMSVIKIVLTPDGRYVPREGRYHDEEPRTVDSTYIIRPPIDFTELFASVGRVRFPGIYRHEFRRFPKQQIHTPIPATLQLPATSKHIPRPLAPSQGKYPYALGLVNNLPADDDLLFNGHQQFFTDYLHPFYTPETFTDFNSLFNDLSFDQRRLVRESSDRKRVRFPEVGAEPAPRFKPRKLGGVPQSNGYPAFTKVLHTNFACSHLERNRDKMFADKQTRCQVFHICQKDGRKDSFLCPKGTVFNEVLSQCDWWYNVRCS